MTKTYAAISPEFGTRFAFNASNETRAQRKIDAWNWYHNFYHTDAQHTVKEIEEGELSALCIELHNEYV